MTDFASVAMMKLIHRGLKQQGIALPSPAPTRGAHVALTDKRAVLVGLAEKFGLDAVLRIGDAVHSVEADPALTALTMAHDAIDLLSRWQRLERYIHSRHRIEFERTGALTIMLKHVSLQVDHPPLPVEDVLVIGLLIALFERVCQRPMSARIHGSSRWIRRNATWAKLPAADAARGFSVWELHLPADNRELAKRDCAEYSRSSFAIRTSQIFQRDLCSAWSVQSLARELAMSARTLQRRLASDGTSFQQALADARVAHAADLLAKSGSLARRNWLRLWLFRSGALQSGIQAKHQRHARSISNRL